MLASMGASIHEAQHRRSAISVVRPVRLAGESRRRGGGGVRRREGVARPDSTGGMEALSTAARLKRHPPRSDGCVARRRPTRLVAPKTTANGLSLFRSSRTEVMQGTSGSAFRPTAPFRERDSDVAIAHAHPSGRQFGQRMRNYAQLLAAKHHSANRRFFRGDARRSRVRRRDAGTSASQHDSCADPGEPYPGVMGARGERAPVTSV